MCHYFLKKINQQNIKIKFKDNNNETVYTVWYSTYSKINTCIKGHYLLSNIRNK